MKNKVLVVAAHPDDETLGCGGTLLKHKANGDKIHWLICTTLNEKNSYYKKREIELSKVSKLFNFDSVHNLPFKEDVHTDHKKLFEASYSCTKSFRHSFIKKIYMMETLSETDFAPSIKKESFTPNTFIDISRYMKKKIQIMKVYKSEIKKHPFPRSERSIRALATFRGSSSGCKFAESFMLLKEIS